MGDVDVQHDAVAARDRTQTEAPRTLTKDARRRRAIAVGVWGAAFLTFCVVRGIPLDRLTQALWILTGLAAATVGTARGRRVVADWLPIFVVLYLYDVSRGVADTLGMPVHTTEMVTFDEAVFGELPTVWLQEQLYDRLVVHWYDVVVAFVYFSHFLVAWVVAVVLYLRSRERWLMWVRRLLVLTFAGLITYVLYPATPPWLASRMNEAPDLDRIATRGWGEIGLHGAGRLIEVGQAGANLVAAMPSLHAALAMLVAVFFWGSVRPWWGKALLASYPLAMAFTLVYGGEHYVIDIVLGWLYVALTCLAVGWWERRRASA